VGGLKGKLQVSQVHLHGFIHRSPALAEFGIFGKLTGVGVEGVAMESKVVGEWGSGKSMAGAESTAAATWGWLVRELRFLAGRLLIVVVHSFS
jgi:hypothetical protein